MKLSLISSVSAFRLTENRVSRSLEASGERTYSQLVDIMKFYNQDFNEVKFFMYGCHCNFHGQPMIAKGHGHPVDSLDTACKAYNDCQNCARNHYGDGCVSERQPYSYSLLPIDGEQVCMDSKDTCKRSLCECDLAFAKASAQAKSVWDHKYHVLWSGRPQDCPVSNSPVDMKCCRDADKSSAFLWYNANNKQCCANGEVKKIGELC